jgi:pyruvate dehydrogenase phosphatase
MPEVTHRRLDDDDGIFCRRNQEYDPSVISANMKCRARVPRRRFLILSSDGFADICGGEEEQRGILQNWARKTIEDEVNGTVYGATEKRDNMALRLLREALGGDNRYKVSRVLTLDMDVAWIDDTSIVVQTM